MILPPNTSEELSEKIKAISKIGITRKPHKEDKRSQKLARRKTRLALKAKQTKRHRHSGSKKNKHS